MLIPIIFIVLLELALQITNYGKDYPTWISVNNEKLILNPEIARKYFSNTQNIPFATEAFIDQVKKNNSFRVFVLGGSSAAGYPYLSSASFSKYVRKGLEQAFPNKTIEVANVSMSAINTYTLKDFLPGLIEKDPDAILIYAGHNEYYGAMGVASTESMGSYPFLTNLMLNLDDYKTVKLIKNIIAGIYSSNLANEKDDTTLMARVAKDKYVPYKSDLYYKGIEQFSNNIEDILSLCKSHNIPTYISTLVSNVRDQKPFVSISDSKLPSADSIYNLALKTDKNTLQADSLYTLAKELDALRFRAPEEINRMIIKLGEVYNSNIIRSDLLFKEYSKDGIIGNDLMTDHLHLNVKGYQLLGKFFIDKILDDEKLNITKDSLHKKILTNYNFTEYDSTTAAFRIKILKNDWPYNKSGNKIPVKELLSPKTMIEKTALDVINSKVSRKEAREKIAKHYLKQNSLDLFIKEMTALKEEFPFLKVSFVNEAKQYLKKKKYDEAFKLLKSSYTLNPEAFSSKWIGIIALSKKDHLEAITYLNRSLKFNPNDAQVLFNLAGAYSDNKNFEKAYEAVNKCLQLNPKNQNAIGMKNQLKNILGR